MCKTSRTKLHQQKKKMIQNNSNVIDVPASSHIVEKKSGCYVLNVHRCECGSFSKPDLRLTALPLVQIK